jgi:O-antigen ligase
MYAALITSLLVALCIPLLPSGARASSPLGGKIVDTPSGPTSLNTFAYIVGPAAAVALGLAAGSGRKSTKYLLGLAAAVCALMLVYTKSRGAWLGFGAAVLYVTMMRRSMTLVLSVAGIGMVAALSGTLRVLFTSRVASTSVYDFALLGRLRLWDFAWRIGKDNWLLGVGMENFRYVKHLYGFPEPLSYAIQYSAHNLYLEVFADLGVVGLALLLWLIARALLSTTRAIQSPEFADVSLGLSAGLVAYLAHGLFDCVFFQPGILALLGFLIGLSISVRRLTSTDDALAVPGVGRLRSAGT